MILPEEKAVYDRLLNIRNDNIANVIGYTEIGKMTYAVREYVCGESIEEYVIYNGKIPDETIRLLVKGICSGLSAIHAAGIVHRDITADNVMIDEEGRAKIIDFGISRLRSKDKSKDSQILGTVGYAAPEQFGFRQTTEKADIYALGVLINYMAEGALPNEKLTDGVFRRVVLKCTQMDETRRYSSIDSVARAIDRKTDIFDVIKKAPGFKGPIWLRILALWWYSSVLLSMVTSTVSTGNLLMIPANFALFILPILFVSDPSGLISRFCIRHALPDKARAFVKVLLVWTAINAGLLLIIISIF